MNREVVIIGASGHGNAVANVVISSGDHIVGFLDDNPNLSATYIGFPVLGTIDNYPNYADKEFIIAIGDSIVREKIAQRLQGVKWYTAIHPTAVISPLAISIGEGTVIMANAVVGPGTIVGKHCIVNTGAIVDHNNTFGDYSHAAGRAILGGVVSVGKHTLIGIGASVKNCTSICDHCLIGTGAVVIKDITESGTYIGVPATKMKKKS